VSKLFEDKFDHVKALRATISSRHFSRSAQSGKFAENLKEKHFPDDFYSHIASAHQTQREVQETSSSYQRWV